MERVELEESILINEYGIWKATTSPVKRILKKLN